jgi:hypothetical protein
MKSSIGLFAAFPFCLASHLPGKIALTDSPDKPPSAVSQLAPSAKEVSADVNGVQRSGTAAMRTKPPSAALQGGTHPSIHHLDNPSLSTAVFIENLGQFNPKVLYQVKIGTQTAWLTKDGITFDATKPTANEGAGRESQSYLDAAGERSELNAGVTRFKMPKSLARTFDRLALAEDFVDATCCSIVDAKDLRPGAYNYFQSSDSTKWRTNVRGYSEVVYHDVWPGIDLRISGRGPDLEQEFVIRPGGDLARVQISYRGIDRLVATPDGALEVETAFGKLHETKPSIYQRIGGKEVAVDGHFKLTSETSYAFEVGAYQTEYALVIDPTVLYSTFLGGSAGNEYGYASEKANGIAVDASGNAYVAGITKSTDFPTTIGALKSSPSSGQVTGFIAKLNATGSALVYSTYLGDTTTITAIAVDTAGVAYVTGFSSSPSYGFPTTPNAYWPTDPNQKCYQDYFVTGLSAAGDQLVYSSCLNSNGPTYGAESGYYPNAIAVDSRGRAYIAGGAGGGSPTTANAYQPVVPDPASDSAYVAVFDTTGSGASSLVYATYLGASISKSPSVAQGIAVDAFGKIYVTGVANAGFPVTTGAFQTTYMGGGDVFIAKLDPTASGSQSLIYSTYLGGAGQDQGNAIAVDASGNAYVTGSIFLDSNTFPVTPGAFQTNTPTRNPAFVTKLNAAGSRLVYSTLLSGTSPAVWGNAIAADSFGSAYVAGMTLSNGDFPLTPDAFQSTCVKIFGQCAAYYLGFLTKLNPTGTALIYSSFLGGNNNDVATAVAIDQTGDAYVAGWTGSFNFPVTGTALQPSMNGTGDAFITKFPLGGIQTLSVSSLTPTSGGNSGTVSPQIFGTGFHAGATAKLSCGGQSIPGANLTVGPEGRYFNTTFDLTAASNGKCDVTVTNPDGSSAKLPQAFTVKQGGAPNLRIYLTGAEVRKVPGEVPLGPADAVMFATVSNTGNVDSAGGFVFEPINAPFSPTSVTPAAVVNLTTLQTDSAVMWNLPAIPAGSSQVLTTTASTMTSSSIATFVAGATCVAAFAAGLGGPELAETAICIGQNAELGDVLACSNAVLECKKAQLTCTEEGPSPDCWKEVEECGEQAWDCANVSGPIVADCIQKVSKACVSSLLGFFEPTDPNGIVGPSGVGGQRWTAGVPALSYAVLFNNEPTATAPAQQVIVTQPLGPNVNLATLKLLGATIPNGSSNIQVPVPPGAFNPAAGVAEFTTNVDLRPNQSLLVNVDAKLDPTARTLTWTFTSIDPATGLPPLNPLVGFLPPGSGANFSFSVTPTPGLATGSQVAEQATVVFDGQAPMSTAAWINTIDNASPISHVSALPTTNSCPNFRVSWSGSDVGSGVQGFTIYASDTGGSFTPWLTNTTAAASTFIGAVGHSYSFYSIAADLTGNVEPAKTLAEASTTVNSASSCGPPSVSGQVLSTSHSGTTVTVNLQLTNTGFSTAQAVNITQITARTLAGSGTVTLGGPILPIAAGPLGIGASTTLTLTLNVPATVTRFSLTESGNALDAASKKYSFSIAQTIIP